MSPPRSLRPRARLETFLTEAGRPRQHPLRVKRIGRRRRDAASPTCTFVGESDSPIVPEKRANNDSVPLSAESVEGRGLTKENAEQSLLDRTQRREPRSRGLLGVREAAQRDKTMRFNNLLHHLTPELLQASFFDLKKQAAPGIDGVTWAQYAEDLDERIDDLHDANPSRNVPSAAVQAGLDSQARRHDCGRWGSRRWKTRSSSKPCGRCWNASTKRTSWVSVTAFGLDEAVTKPWMRFTWASRRGK